MHCRYLHIDDGTFERIQKIAKNNKLTIDQVIEVLVRQSSVAYENARMDYDVELIIGDVNHEYPFQNHRNDFNSNSGTG